MELNATTDAAAIAELAVRGAKPEVVSLGDGRKYLVTAEGSYVQDVTDPQDRSRVGLTRIRQGVTLQEVNSLVDYAVRFKGEGSTLLADIAANRIVAALDYHEPGAADFVDHVATMDLPFSEEWRTWKDVDGKMLPQLEFARFIEENASDVEAPSGADLIEVCRDIQAARNVDFRGAVRTNSDNENFEYVDETKAQSKNGGVEIPNRFQLRLPVYFNGASVNLYAFLRWRLDDGKLFLGVKLHRAEHVRQAVFKEIVGDVADRTGLQAVFGRLNS